MVRFETFEDWYHELENFNFRSDRFLQHLDLVQSDPEQRNKFVENWLRAAFEAGRYPEDKFV